MTEKAADRVIKETKKNYAFGTAIIFQGRCIQAWPKGKNFELSSGCYSTTDNLPEFEAMKKAGTTSYREVDMGKNLVKVHATMNEKQFKEFVTSADEADWEA